MTSLFSSSDSVIKKSNNGLVTDNSEREALYRKAKAKEADKHLDSFLDLFTKTGLNPEKQANIDSVPIAKSITDIGQKIGGLISSFEDSTLTKIEEGGNKFLEGQTANAKPVNLPSSILIGLSTAVIIVESLVILIFSVFRGIAEAIMRGACALADLLYINFRKYFPETNNIQSIMIAILYFVGYVYSNLRNFIAHFLKSVDQIIVGFFLVKFDKTLSSAVDNGINIIFNIIEFYILLYFLKFKILLITILVLTIVSFFLKMEDLPKTRGFASDIKTKAFGDNEGGADTGAFDFFAYVDGTATTSPLDFLKSE